MRSTGQLGGNQRQQQWSLSTRKCLNAVSLFLEHVLSTFWERVASYLSNISEKFFQLLMKEVNLHKQTRPS